MSILDNRCQISDFKGKVSIAFVVANNSINTGDIEEIVKRYIEERLPIYCVPKRVFVIDFIPMTPIGKIDYRALEKQAEEMSNV